MSSEKSSRKAAFALFICLCLSFLSAYSIISFSIEKDYIEKCKEGKEPLSNKSCENK